MRGEERARAVETLRLHVLAERQRHRPARGRIGQHRNRPRQGRRASAPGGGCGRNSATRGGSSHWPRPSRRRNPPPAAAPDRAGARRTRPPGSNSTGSRLTCATAAAVTMLVAPGPIEVVHAIIRRRPEALAKAIAACAIACSLWPRNVGSASRRLRERLAEPGDIAMAEDRPHAGEKRNLAGLGLDALGSEIAAPAPGPWSGGSLPWIASSPRFSRPGASVGAAGQDSRRTRLALSQPQHKAAGARMVAPDGHAPRVAPIVCYCMLYAMVFSIVRSASAPFAKAACRFSNGPIIRMNSTLIHLRR